MAHKIHIGKTGMASFFTVKEKAWHGLGQVLESCPTSEEAIIYAGLNFEVDLAEIYAKYPTSLMANLGKGKKIDSKFATYRTDTGDVFGVVGGRYTTVQNKDAFSFFDSIVDEGEAIYETAGALGNGETIFITAKLPGYISVAKNDDIEKYILLTMSHDGTSSIKAMFTPIRVVCNNTLQAALSDRSQSSITIRHTKSAHDRLKIAHTILGITNKKIDVTTEMYQEMTKVRIKDAELDVFIANALDLKIEEDGTMSTRSNNLFQAVKEYTEIGAGQNLDSAKGTLWGAYNGVNGYLNNMKDYKNLDDRMTSLIDGSSAKISTNALAIAQSVLTNEINLSDLCLS